MNLSKFTVQIAEDLNISIEDFENNMIGIQKQNPEFDIESVKEPNDYTEVFNHIIRALNITERKNILNNIYNKIQDLDLSHKEFTSSTIVNTCEIEDKFVISAESCAQYVSSNPLIGMQIAIADAVRKINCSGGEPRAINVCTNLHSYNSEDNWKLLAELEGIVSACEKFNIPVLGRNIEFNTSTGNLFPLIGMLGVLNSNNHITPFDIKGKSDLIFMIGKPSANISSSVYLETWHNVKDSQAPRFNMDDELRLNKVIQRLTQQGLIRTSHNVSRGGILIALIQSAMHNSLGFDILSDAEVRKDAFLFGEAQGRVIVSVAEHLQDNFIDFMQKTDVPFNLLGHVTRGEIRVDDESYGFISDFVK